MQNKVSLESSEFPTMTVKLNVGGKLHIISLDMLARLPDTKLGKMAISLELSTVDENFFDRSHTMMDCILDLYRVGELHIPGNICGLQIANELRFWEILEEMISECCWKYFHAERISAKTIDEIEHSLADPYKLSANIDFQKTSVFFWVWSIMDNRFTPWTKIEAAWRTLYFIMVVTSVITFSLETMHVYRTIDHNEHIDYSDLTKHEVDLFSHKVVWLRWLDFSTTVFFTVEPILRLLLVPNKCVFLKIWSNILDFVLIITMWAGFLIEEWIMPKIHHPTLSYVYLMVFLRAILALRVLRVAHLTKRSRSMKVMLLSIRASSKEMSLLMVCVFMATLVFGNAAYIAEIMSSTRAFDDVPQGIWWALITLTTVGYGDFVPKNALSYGVGSLCAITGLLLLSMPIAIIATNFSNYYSNTSSYEHRVNRQKSLEALMQKHPKQGQEYIHYVLSHKPKAENTVEGDQVSVFSKVSYAPGQPLYSLDPAISSSVELDGKDAKNPLSKVLIPSSRGKSTDERDKNVNAARESRIASVGRIIKRKAVSRGKVGSTAVNPLNVESESSHRRQEPSCSGPTANARGDHDERTDTKDADTVLSFVSEVDCPSSSHSISPSHRGVISQSVLGETSSQSDSVQVVEVRADSDSVVNMFDVSVDDEHEGDPTLVEQQATFTMHPQSDSSCQNLNNATDFMEDSEPDPNRTEMETCEPDPNDTDMENPEPDPNRTRMEDSILDPNRTDMENSEPDEFASISSKTTKQSGVRQQRRDRQRSHERQQTRDRQCKLIVDDLQLVYPCDSADLEWKGRVTSMLHKAHSPVADVHTACAGDSQKNTPEWPRTAPSSSTGMSSCSEKATRIGEISAPTYEAVSKRRHSRSIPCCGVAHRKAAEIARSGNTETTSRHRCAQKSTRDLNGNATGSLDTDQGEEEAFTKSTDSLCSVPKRQATCVEEKQTPIHDGTGTPSETNQNWDPLPRKRDIASVVPSEETANEKRETNLKRKGKTDSIRKGRPDKVLFKTGTFESWKMASDDMVVMVVDYGMQSQGMTTAAGDTECSHCLLTVDKIERTLLSN